MITDKLITDAYYLSNKVSRELETVAGADSADGLRMLNDLLSEKSMSGVHIPYHTHLSFNAVIGQEEYSIPDLISVDALTYNINDNLRSGILRSERNRYFGSSKVLDTNGLPFEYHVEREKGGSKIYLYLNPIDTYQFNITGKFALSELTLDTVVSDILDRFYISYLTYELAQRICDFNSLEFPAGKAARLKSLQTQLEEVSVQDFRILKSSTLSEGRRGSWTSAVSLFTGYLP